MKYTVALTGGIGSGKSTVADAFSRVGITVVDADIIAREVVEPGQPALESIYQHFGPEILLPEGALIVVRYVRRSLISPKINAGSMRFFIH